MFRHHSALRRNPRAAYAGVPSVSYLIVKTLQPFSFAGARAPLKAKLYSVLNSKYELPVGAIIFLRSGGSLEDYAIYNVNGVPVNLETDAGDMGNAAEPLENFLETSGVEVLFSLPGQFRDNKAKAEAELPKYLGGGSTAAAPATVTSGDEDESSGVSSEAEPETSDASEPAASPAPAKSTPAYVPKTGYYKDSAGYAWYYNASQDYLEAIAAPKGKYTTQPRFSKSSGSGDYAKMKGILTAENATDRASAIKNATDKGGEPLPERRASTPAPAAPVPTEVANRGAAQTNKKKGVPAWVWWTSGTVVVAGLGVWGAIALKKRNEANQ